MKVTILIAVYNAAEYIGEALDSVLRQTHQDLEVLCVDDASTDNSWQILQQYMLKDQRIKAWRQTENHGQAVARNLAMEHATGDIVAFLDSDDWLSDDALERIVATFEGHTDTDCVLMKCKTVELDGSLNDFPSREFSVLTGREAFRLSLTWQIHGVYAVRIKLQREHPYDTTCRHFSDDNTTRLHYYHSREVRQCDAIYYYRMRESSVTHCINTSRIDYLKANQSMRKQLQALQCDTDVMAEYENHRWLNLLEVELWYMRNKQFFDASERTYCLSEIRKAWESIDESLLLPSNTGKPGYYNFHGWWQELGIAWPLFRLQMVLFAALRRLINR